MGGTPAPSVQSIRDRDTLEAWLMGRDRVDAVAIAHRAALRVFVLYGAEMDEDWARENELTALPILRCYLITAAAALMPTAEIRAAAAASADAAAAADAAASADAAAYAHAASASAAAFASADAADAFAYADAASAFAAAALASAAFASGAVSAVSAAVWLAVQVDAQALESGHSPLSLPLWPHTPPDFIAKAEGEMISLWDADPSDRWDFWRRWYATAKAGRYLDPKLQLAIVERVPDDLWTGPDAPDRVAAAIRKIEAEFATGNEEEGKTNRLADAAYFDFVEVNRQMRAVAFPSDYAAFADDAAREKFAAAINHLQDLLRDWCELARAQLHGRNRPVTVVVAVDQLLDQFRAIERGDYVSLRNLIRKGSTARSQARESNLEADLGENLYENLTDALDEYTELARLHLGDVLVALDVLRNLELGDLDSGEILAILKAGVAQLQQEGPDALLPPDPRTQAILNDMLAELEDEQAEIGEATTDTARARRGKRFAEKYGGVSATFGRYVEKGSELANKGTDRFDDAVKWYKRWDTLEKIVEWWNDLGAPTP